MVRAEAEGGGHAVALYSSGDGTEWSLRAALPVPGNETPLDFDAAAWDALFRIGGADRSEGTQSFWLRSGDVLLMGGSARLAWHGVDRIRPASSTLLPQGGRINLTCRVVTKV